MEFLAVRGKCARMITATNEQLSHRESSPFFPGFVYMQGQVIITQGWSPYLIGAVTILGRSAIDATTLPSHSLKLGITLVETIHVRTLHTLQKRDMY